MSAQALGWVLDHSPTEGAERLVLLSLANHAKTAPAGGAWETDPPVEVLQKEANLRRERTVQEVLARLVASGHIERIVNGSPDERVRADRRPNLYRILLSRGVRLKAGSSASSRGAVSRTSRGAAARRNGNAHGVPPDAHDGVPPDADSRHANGVPADAHGVPPHAAPQPPRSSSFPRTTTTFSQSSVTASTGAREGEDGRTDPRIGPVAAALGLRDHDAAVAANDPPVKRRAAHLEACVDRWLTGTLRVVIDGMCAEYPEWTVEQVVGEIDSPGPSGRVAAPGCPPLVTCERCAENSGWIELADGMARCDHVPGQRPDLRSIQGGAA